MNKRAVVVGIGSPHGDDQVGWRIAEELAHLAPTANVHLARSPAELLDVLDDRPPLWICDGCRGLGESGTVHRWRWPHLPADEASFSGTHALPLVAALKLAQHLDRLPADVRIWGVEIGNPILGASLTPGMALVASQLAREILLELCDA